MATSDPRSAAHPKVRALLEAMSAGRATRVLEAATLRLGIHQQIPALVAGAPEVAREETIEIPGPAGGIRALVFHPKQPDSERPPVLLYLHGGGWVIMSPESHAKLAKRLGASAGAIVVSVDYRLAPEHPYPAALDDAVEAYRWVRANAEQLGGDPARVGVAGDSAGGNLSAATALRLQANAEAPPRCVLLICPVADAAFDTDSYRRLAPDDPVLDDAIMRFFRESYVTREQWEDPFVSPLHANLEGFPPTCVVAAELDPLYDDAVHFAERLRAAGGDVALRRYPGMPHIFMLFPGIDASDGCFEDMGAFLRERL